MWVALDPLRLRLYLMDMSMPPITFLDRSTPPHISTLILLVGIGALSMSFFLPSLPHIAEAFDADYALVQLSVSAYLAVTAVLQVLVGPISDRYGRRPVVLGALALFIFASLGAMLAPNIYVFLAFRMAQGAVAVTMVMGRAIVRDMVPQEEAASMIGWVTMGMSLVPMIGPMVGGTVDQLFGWRPVFAVLAIFGSGVFLLAYRDQGETLKSGGLSFAEQLRTYPELLSSQRFWGYVLSSAFAAGGFFAFLGGAPLIASETFALGPVATGIALSAPAVGYAIGNGIAGRYSIRFGVNRMILIGALVTLVGMVLSPLMSLLGAHGPFSFFGWVVLLGLGNGILLPNANAGMLSVRPHLAGTASGLGGAVLIGLGAVMSAFAGAQLDAGTGAMPLQLTMMVAAILSTLAILWVMRREKQLGLDQV